MDTTTAIQVLTAHLGGVARDNADRPINPDLSKVSIITAISLALDALKLSNELPKEKAEAVPVIAPVTVPAEPVKIAPPVVKK